MFLLYLSVEGFGVTQCDSGVISFVQCVWVLIWVVGCFDALDFQLWFALECFSRWFDFSVLRDCGWFVICDYSFAVLVDSWCCLLCSWVWIGLCSLA